MWLGCYRGAMWRPWDGVVVAGVRGLTFTENGPFKPLIWVVNDSPPAGRAHRARNTHCAHSSDERKAEHDIRVTHIQTDANSPEARVSEEP